jgi:hypothetical protein
LAVLLDFKQAYNRVWRTGLLLKLQRLGVISNVYRWIEGFLAERTVANTLWESDIMEAHSGVKTAPAISTVLYTVPGFPQRPAEISGNLERDVCGRPGYVENRERYNCSRDISPAGFGCRVLLRQDVETGDKLCQNSYPLFALRRDVLWILIRLTIDGQELRYEPKPVCLGVTLDRKLSMCDHVRLVRENAISKLSIVKLSTSWGSEGECMES